VGRLSARLADGVTGQDGGTVWFASGSSGTTTHRSLWKMDQGFTPQLVAPLDRGVVYAASALIGSTLYAVGGTDDQAGIERVANTFLAIDVKTGAIKRLSDYPEAGLTTGTAAAVGDRLLVFGGARWDPVEKKVVNHSSAHAYSVTQNRWESLPPLPHPGRGYSAVKLDDRHILVAGGYRNDTVEFVADAFVYNVDSRTFTATNPLPYAAMVSLVKSGDWLYCIGGEDRKRHRTDAFYRIRWRELLRGSR
jgi:N-acetylneuraminic acid mutarotase